MRKLIADEWVTLDGVMQAPGQADEDTSGGFRHGGDLHLIGSGELVQTLFGQGLVDEFRLMIDPVVVGGGKRLFRDDGVLSPLRLVDSQVSTTGVIIATYAPAAG
jgi:dihydrofolate reductase